MFSFNPRKGSEEAYFPKMSNYGRVYSSVEEKCLFDFILALVQMTCLVSFG